jgi:hypothetical protein
VVFSVKNTGTGPGALWCSVSLQKGSNPLSVTQPTEYPPALGAKATRTLTVGVPPGAPGTPDTAEVVCGISKTAVSNSNAFASGSTLAAVNPMALLVQAVRQPGVPDCHDRLRLGRQGRRDCQDRQARDYGE